MHVLSGSIALEVLSPVIVQLDISAKAANRHRNQILSVKWHSIVHMVPPSKSLAHQVSIGQSREVCRHQIAPLAKEDRYVN